jgi:c-di-GMP-binding flagellar brake protein YcgR
MVTLTMPDRTDAIVTSVLDVDEEQDVVIVDGAPSRNLNERFVKAERLLFETTLDKIRISFSSTCRALCIHGGTPALLLEIPDQIVRLQRREYYRVATPLAEPVRCMIPLPQDLGQGMAMLSLVDISCGGIAVLEEKQMLDETIGRQYDNCRIELPGISTIVTTLQIRDYQEVVLPSGKRKRRLGLEFVNLPPAMLAAVQRYIMKAERDQNARTSGLV